MNQQDITGRQVRRPTRRRGPQPLGSAPGSIRQIEIAAWARQQFPTPEIIQACRSGSRFAAQDRARRQRGGTGQARPLSWRQRWGKYLIQTGHRRLTVAQKRAVRRRLTRADIAEMAPWERRMLGVEL